MSVTYFRDVWFWF